VRIAIVGSRDYPCLQQVVDFINGLPEGTVVISGGARGVDQTAENAARARGLQVESYPVTPEQWRTLGRKAGMLRNTVLIELSDTVVAFWDEQSKGTLDSIRKAEAANKLLCVLTPRDYAASLAVA